MKRFHRFGRYGLLGVFNTVLGYVLFVALATLMSQLLASVITEILVQSFKYYGLGKFVFRAPQRTRPSPLAYLISVLPGSLVLFLNVAIFSRFLPPAITGALGILVSIIYYKIFKALYRPRLNN
ncbi:MAG: GtrA family protein [Synechococcaceae cyanobacterium]|nr:GtrA family protein [Synechococcaceae cyanobacterium]